MPCETCHVQFSVFRRKRICTDCKRFYCSNCLTTTKRNAVLCRRCAIFAKRPLLRADLLQLKPKDLIFYLQSKHISTAGCVEKEELVGLVLTHAQMQGDGSQSPNGSGRSRSEHSNSNNTNSFDTLKQSCQTFFSNLSDNITDSFSTFDATKTTNKPPNNRRNGQYTSSNYGTTHIYEQPRVRRQLPTYASFQSGTHESPAQQSSASSGTHQRNIETVNVHVSSDSSSSPTASPVASPLSSKSLQPNQKLRPDPCNISNHAAQNAAEEQSDCECSDDEILATYSERLSIKTKPKLESNSVDQGSSGATTSESPGCSKQNSLSSKVDGCGAEISSQSSFEELGAIGGISDESKATTDTNSNSNTEQWQILDAQKIEATTSGDLNTTADCSTSKTDELQEAVFPQETPTQQDEVQKTQQQETQTNSIAPQRLKKVIRRRSDGYLNRRHISIDDDSPVGDAALNLSTLTEQPETVALQTNRKNCQRCGKNKTNIRRHVEKMRQHLESSQMSEEDIKRELKEFLEYLEQRTKSIDCSDTESRANSSLSGVAAAAGGGGVQTITPTIEFTPTPTESDVMEFNENDGIHVYAAPANYEPSNANIDSRFINLEDFEDFKELENLTVKQLKEVLMLHRVDYKGCCEKQELLDRVTRLWHNMRSAPAVEKLPTDELCKICMDAPIECVFLECGHMATCTSCGKVLNECPICRQYIVRVVRFFRA